MRRSVRPPRINPSIDLKPLQNVDAEALVKRVRARMRGLDTKKEHARAKVVLEKHGYTVGKKLGSGQAATVYELPEYPDFVVKLTYDELDATVMAEVQRLGKRPGLPDVVAVADLGNHLYGIVIERAMPLTQAEQDRVNALGERTGFGREAHASVLKHYAKSPRETELLVAAKTLRDLGFTPTDLHGENVMRRKDGSWVITDLGFSLPGKSRSRDIPALKNPARRSKNPARHTPPLRRNPLPARLRPTRRNPVVDLSNYLTNAPPDDDEDYLEMLKERVWDLSPGGQYAAPDEPVRDIRDDWARDVLEKHEIETDPVPLGRGASATVFELASDPSYVVKITNDPLDAAAMAEAQFASTLRGTQGIPKVAAVYHLGKVPKKLDPFGEAGGPVYVVVMERMFPLTEIEKAGVRTVSKYNRGWGLTPEEVRSLLATVPEGSPQEAWLKGVAFLHARGFRPSDLHANNIMRRKDGTYAISDFGLSFAIRGQRDKSRNLPKVGEKAPSARRR